jgi:hypothetical protein
MRLFLYQDLSNESKMLYWIPSHFIQRMHSLLTTCMSASGKIYIEKRKEGQAMDKRKMGNK